MPDIAISFSDSSGAALSSNALPTTFTPAAWNSNYITIAYEGTGSISGHNDHTPTTCPGRSLKTYLPTLQQKVTDAARN